MRILKGNNEIEVDDKIFLNAEGLEIGDDVWDTNILDLKVCVRLTLSVLFVDKHNN
jgi:hypothetical protein